MQQKYYVALLMPVAARASIAGSIQTGAKSTNVCKLLQAAPNPHLMPIDENDWPSLLDSAEEWLRHE